MNQVYTGIIMLIGLAASSTAAAGGAFTGRAGVTLGTYEFNSREVDLGCCGNPIGFSISNEDNSGQYGVLGGLGLNAGLFFADVGLEVDTYNEKYDLDGDGVEENYFRTDGLLTLGVFIGSHWSVFGGYRHATFGDGVFSEEYGNTENGPFLGGGFSFRPGKKVSLGMSAAYNSLTLSYDGTNVEDIDLDGFSVKFNLGFVGTPHAIFLRWQRFDGEYDEEPGYLYEYTEDYLNLGYQATFGFASW
jgi:hypothetical protein